MHAFNSRGIDKDFVQWARLRQISNSAWAQLDRQILFVFLFIGELKIIGAQGGANQQQVAPQNSVFVKVGNALQPFQNFLLQALNALIVFLAACRVQTRVEFGLKQSHQVAGKRDLIKQRVGNVGLGKIKLRLMQIVSISAQQYDFAPVQSRTEHQTVEFITLGSPVPDCCEGILKVLLDSVNINIGGERVT